MVADNRSSKTMTWPQFVERLRQRADWIRKEYLSGGSFEHLSAREQECTYIASLAQEILSAESPTVETQPASNQITEAFDDLDRYCSESSSATHALKVLQAHIRRFLSANPPSPDEPVPTEITRYDWDDGGGLGGISSGMVKSTTGCYVRYNDIRHRLSSAPETQPSSNRMTPEKLAEYEGLLPLGRFCGVGGDALKLLLDEIKACWAARSAPETSGSDPNICGDDGPITPEQCALWLDAKYRRHGELEDRAAAMWLRKLSASPVKASERCPHGYNREDLRTGASTCDVCDGLNGPAESGKP